MDKIEIDDLIDFTAFCDPASGKTANKVKKVRARSAIAVVAQDHFQRIYVLKAWGKRVKTDDLMEEILDTQEVWQPRVFGIEANAMQSLFADAVKREARFNDVHLPLRAVTQPTKIDKIYRIRAALQPVIAEGRLVIGDSMLDLKHELISFPMSPTVDIVDALASAIALLPKRARAADGSERNQGYAQYLRDTGAPEWYIERELKKNYARTDRKPRKV